jgi:hypothetical protein
VYVWRSWSTAAYFESSRVYRHILSSKELQALPWPRARIDPHPSRRLELCCKYRDSQGSIPSRDGGRIRHRLMGTIVHHARYPHTKARMCSAALMYIRAALAASHACAWPRDNEPWADRPGRSHRERIMTERLIQDNETPPLSASLKMVVKSATTLVREFKKGCKVCYNLWWYQLDLHIL